MQQRAVGASGLKVGRLGLGTMTWGRETDADEAAASLTAFRDAGGTLIDTADVYTDGRAEEILGTLLSGGSAREELVVATKAGLPTVAGSGSSRRHLLAALDASLDRLRTDHLDLWQVHRFDASVPVEETLAALDLAVASGRTRYVGVSNYAGWQLAQSATWQRAVPGRVPLVSNQVEYSLLERGIEREVVDAAAAGGVGLLPWSPLGRGVLTGKYRRGTPSDSRGNAETYTGWIADYLTDRCTSIVDAVLTAADGLGTSPVALSLAWVRDRPGVVAPIVGARSAAQLQAALASESVELPAEIVAALDDVSAPTTGYPERAR